MSDRELLELAAKAAHIDIASAIWSARDGFVWIDSDKVPGFRVSYWNPISNDGDALRLAVTLRENLGTEVSSFFGLGRFDEYRSDPYAATRRAIVRAAAAIGKEMP